ncbi:MAG: SGNH/GDSL hydrolase family protein [Oscillospiraceae bacterium]|nr:SGNH/GDSL hydrolase family protein [Oscillospiraceae bacterium]
MRVSKKIAAIIAAAAMGVLFVSCSENKTESSNDKLAVETENQAPETVPKTTAATEPLTPEEQARMDMIGRSFVSMGNTHRIEEKLTKAMRGEKITVAYIGGSITEGIGGDKENCYAKLSYNYIAEHYGTGDNVEYVNAGVSGTPSVLGNLRVQKDVLDYEPDIVFVEFAVNDGMEQIYKESYESLLRTILQQENEPAVMLLFTVTSTGHTCQPHMSELGEYYGLPMISVPDAIQPEIEAGRMTWADYSDDEAHPNMEGHKLVAEFIGNWFRQNEFRNMVEPDYSVPVLPKFGAPYENAFLAVGDYDNSNENIQIGDTGSFSQEARRIADFTKGAWVYKGEGTEPLKMKVRGNSLFLVCKRNNSETMGSFEVWIDGQKANTINTNQKDGWGEPYAFQVIKWSSVRDMEVEIVPTEDSAGKTIEIFGIACSQVDSISF